MKNKIFLFLVLLNSIVIYSQNRYKGQSILGMTVGKASNNSFFINPNYSYYLNNKGLSLRVDGVLKKFDSDLDYLPSDSKVAIDHFMLMPSISKSFDQLGIDPIYLSVNIGFFGGYEMISKSKVNVLFKDSQSEHFENIFIYGLSAGGDIEIQLSRNLTLDFNIKEINITNSNIENWSLFIGGGIRIYL